MTCSPSTPGSPWAWRACSWACPTSCRKPSDSRGCRPVSPGFRFVLVSQYLRERAFGVWSARIRGGNSHRVTFSTPRVFNTALLAVGRAGAIFPGRRAERNLPSYDVLGLLAVQRQLRRASLGVPPWPGLAWPGLAWPTCCFLLEYPGHDLRCDAHCRPPQAGDTCVFFCCTRWTSAAATWPQ